MTPDPDRPLCSSEQLAVDLLTARLKGVRVERDGDRILIYPPDGQRYVYAGSQDLGGADSTRLFIFHQLTDRVPVFVTGRESVFPLHIRPGRS